MPISRSLHCSRKAVVVRLSLPYSVSELRGALSDVFGSPEFHDCRRLLIDRTSAPAPLTAFIDAAVAAAHPFATELAQTRTAILVGDTASFGMARMTATKFQMQSGGPDIGVFRNEGEALEWLTAT